jgi:hypothetical protein
MSRPVRIPVLPTATLLRINETSVLQLEPMGKGPSTPWPGCSSCTQGLATPRLRIIPACLVQATIASKGRSLILPTSSPEPATSRGKPRAKSLGKLAHYLSKALSQHRNCMHPPMHDNSKRSSVTTIPANGRLTRRFCRASGSVMQASSAGMKHGGC